MACGRGGACRALLSQHSAARCGSKAGELPGVEGNQLLVRAIGVDRVQECGGGAEERREVAAGERRWWQRGDNDGGEGEGRVQTQAGETGGQLRAGDGVTEACQEHMGDGFVDGSTRGGAVGAGRADGGGLHRFGEALPD